MFVESKAHNKAQRFNLQQTIQVMLSRESVVYEERLWSHDSIYEEQKNDIGNRLVWILEQRDKVNDGLERSELLVEVCQNSLASSEKIS